MEGTSKGGLFWDTGPDRKGKKTTQRRKRFNLTKGEKCSKKREPNKKGLRGSRKEKKAFSTRKEGEESTMQVSTREEKENKGRKKKFPGRGQDGGKGKGLLGGAQCDTKMSWRQRRRFDRIMNFQAEGYWLHERGRQKWVNQIWRGNRGGVRGGDL